MYNHRSKDLQNAKANALRKYFIKKRASYTKRLQSMDSPGEWKKIPRQ